MADRRCFFLFLGLVAPIVLAMLRSHKSPNQARHVKLLYATQGGKARATAEQAADLLRSLGAHCEVIDLKSYDPEELPGENVVAFVVPTYHGGQAPASAQHFFKWLEDYSQDFRVPRNALQKLKFVILGLGDSAYSTFNQVALDLDKALRRLGACPLQGFVLADESTELTAACENWVQGLPEAILGSHTTTEPAAAAVSSPRPIDEEFDEGDDDDDDDGAEPHPPKTLVDLEDLGEVYGKSKSTAEMLNPRLRANLTKQGYKLIGSHSGVKLCRWTKAMLRGRGGCYKHTFYGINSSQCMEMTPSLACANKCVFCWRHHTNPVTREWRWKADDPEFLVTGAVDAHVQMIRTMKGVPGVQMDRFEEAQTPRHCALSLVGEPILYPEINRLVGLLHERRISTFMVTNAQFPERIEQLVPVTQLYISVDAATEETLKAVDRPLFEDFWPRFLGSIDALARKGHRTVFRLTLVKGWNMDHVRQYAELVARGTPDFVEVKGVTYCGDNSASDLTIKNSPYHEEVVRFCTELCAVSNALVGSEVYAAACEHAHSVCVLLAHRKFLRDGHWHTWIDYPKFFELAAREGEGAAFTSMDYVARTPDWAVFGADARGFDPGEVRHPGKHKGGGC